MAEAAKVGGMDRQTLRDSLIRFKDQGPGGVINIPRGCSAKPHATRPRAFLREQERPGRLDERAALSALLGDHSATAHQLMAIVMGIHWLLQKTHKGRPPQAARRRGDTAAGVNEVGSEVGTSATFCDRHTSGKSLH